MILPELIEALEKAAGGSRELDWRVAGYLGEIPAHRIIDVGFDYDWYRTSETGWSLWKATDAEGRSIQLWQPPQATTSVDAAMALCERVMPGWRIRTEHGENYSISQFLRGWGARKEILGVATSERPDDHIALCICATALRAKLSQEKNNADH